jgi:hypothetical protein
MNRITAIALYVMLTAAPGMSAYAQSAAMPDAKSPQMQRASDRLIHCTHHADGPQAQQPCNARRADEATRIGSDVTRQELECVLSGVCSVGERGRDRG